MQLEISFIIPVYNRPDEIEELLQSILNLEGGHNYEIVIVEDGSTVNCQKIIDNFKDKLQISYYYKPNSGPGDSRNYGMSRAKGNYFIILDSDCILPAKYLNEVTKSLDTNFVDCFGGPDAAHESFTNIQKAINFSMTSFITTGGIRGKKGSVDKFQPRSFNMGISKKAFQDSNGFGRIHPGEDPDLSIRLESLGYKTKLIPEAFVYHKRRISWFKFYKQVNKFGMVRPILNRWHPTTKKLTYWFPSLFIIGFILSIILGLMGIKLPLLAFGIYFGICFLSSLISSANIVVALLAIPAVLIQFYGYGIGFISSSIKLLTSNKKAEELFPKLFFAK